MPGKCMPPRKSQSKASAAAVGGSAPARGLCVLWPDGNELIPLIHILSNLRFECTQDLPGQLAAGFAIAQGFAIVIELREDFDRIPGGPADEGHPDQRADGGRSSDIARAAPA